MFDYSPKPHPYKKLGGWLLAFVVSGFLALPAEIAGLLLEIKRANDFAALYNAAFAEPGNVLPGYQPAWGDFISFFPSIVFLVIAILIVRRNPRFLLLYQLACPIDVALFLAGIFADGLFAGLVDEIGRAWAILLIIPITLLLAFACFPLMFYYTQSVRVRTYMGTDEYLKLALFTKKIKGPEPAAPDVPLDKSAPWIEKIIV